MKRMRRSILCFVALFVWAPMLDAQTADLSKYRDFSIGTSVTVVLSGTGQKPDEVTAISNRPGLIQQLTWWPGTLPGTPMHKDAVEHIVFNFFNNALYKISVTYERKATEGLTPDDMIESLSAKYGSPANVTPQTVQNPNDRYAARREPVASGKTRNIHSASSGLLFQTISNSSSSRSDSTRKPKLPRLKPPS